MPSRAVEAVVYPFSFREHLRHHRREPDKASGRLTKAQRSSLEKDLLGYLAAGGFPEAQGLKVRERHELLRGYVDVALLRDVVERHAVSHPVVRAPARLMSLAQALQQERAGRSRTSWARTRSR